MARTELADILGVMSFLIASRGLQRFVFASQITDHFMRLEAAQIGEEHVLSQFVEIYARDHLQFVWVYQSCLKLQQWIGQLVRLQ
jgi:hypothetical protein